MKVYKLLTGLLCLICVVLFTSNLSAQELTSEEDNSIKWTQLVGVEGLFESEKIGVGIGYKTYFNTRSNVGIGFGVGFDTYNASNRRSFIPITIELMGDLAEKKIIPFYTLSAGYSLGLKEEPEFASSSKGGFTANIGVGVRHKTPGAKIQPFVVAGYKFQKARYEGVDIYGNDGKDVMYKRWMVRMGLFF